MRCVWVGVRSPTQTPRGHVRGDEDGGFPAPELCNTQRSHSDITNSHTVTIWSGLVNKDLPFDKLVLCLCQATSHEK